VPVRDVNRAGADVMGANCGDLDPLQMAKGIATLEAAAERPIIAQPNAGRPRPAWLRTRLDMAPGPFADGIAGRIRAGA
jgi:methionine synthase I (cobalamin-dependent)